MSFSYIYGVITTLVCYGIYFALSRAICIISQSNDVVFLNSRFRATYPNLDINAMLADAQSHSRIGDVNFGGGKFGRVALVDLTVIKLLIIKPYPAILRAKIAYNGTVLSSCWPLLKRRSNFFDSTSHPDHARSLVQSGVGGMLTTTLNGQDLCVGIFPANRHVLAIDLSAIIDPKTAQLYTLGRLTTKIAHDFNNLLTGTMGFCDLLSFKHSDKEIGEIKNNTQRAIDLVAQILDWARPTCHSQDHTNAYKTLVQMQSFLDCITGSSIRVKVSGFKYAKSLAKIRPSAFEQVVTNLVTNARDSIAGRGVIEINVHKEYMEDFSWVRGEVHAGKYVLIRIRDSGPGIPKAKSQEIFSRSYSTKSTGTGQGLSIVADLLHEVGGFIINLPVDDGALFEVGIPAISRDRIALNKQDELHGGRHDSSVNDHRILVIEDDCSIRALIGVALKKSGYKVQAVSQLCEAREKLQRYRFDLVLTDSDLPDGNGLELLDACAQRNCKLLLVSGYSTDELSKHAGGKRKFNKLEFLPKPFTLMQLTEKVRSVLE